MNEGGWVLIGLVVGIAATFGILIMNANGKFSKFKKKKDEFSRFRKN